MLPGGQPACSAVLLALIFIPVWLKWLCAGVGLVFAVLFGFSFGRTVPQWTEDSMLGEYYDIGQTKSGIRPLTDQGAGMGHLATENSCLNPLHQSFAPALFLTLAIGFIWLGYIEPQVVPDGWSGGEWVFFPPIKWALIAAVLAYAVARLTVKGPVGPLE